MIRCLQLGLGDDRHVQALAEYVREISNRDTLVGDPMISPARNRRISVLPLGATGGCAQSRRPRCPPTTPRTIPRWAKIPAVMASTYSVIRLAMCSGAIGSRAG